MKKMRLEKIRRMRPCCKSLIFFRIFRRPRPIFTPRNSLENDHRDCCYFVRRSMPRASKARKKAIRASSFASAKSRSVAVDHPVYAVDHPVYAVDHPVYQVVVDHPVCQVAVDHSVDQVAVDHPVDQVAVDHPVNHLFDRVFDSGVDLSCEEKLYESSDQSYGEDWTQSEEEVKPSVISILKVPARKRTGPSRATVFRKKARLKRMSKGCHKITKFFQAGNSDVDQPLSDNDQPPSDNDQPPAESDDELCALMEILDVNRPEVIFNYESTHAKDTSIITQDMLNDIHAEIKKLMKMGDHVLAVQHRQLIAQYWRRILMGQARLKASMQVSKDILGKGLHAARTIRSMSNEYVACGDISLSRRGRHSKVQSTIDIPFVREAIQDFLDGRRRTNPTQLRFWLNSYLPDQGFGQVSMRTARRWLKYLGFTKHRRCKAVYFDGHERKDVVDYRQNEFLPAMDQLDKLRAVFSGDQMEIRTPPFLNGDRKEIFLQYHDESIFHANDIDKEFWGPEDAQELPKKGQGRSDIVKCVLSDL